MLFALCQRYLLHCGVKSQQSVAYIFCAKDGATEEEALLEAALQSTSLMGNFDPSADTEPDLPVVTPTVMERPCTPGSSAARSRSVTLPLKQPAWMTFVNAYVCTSGVDAPSAPEQELKHAAFALELACESWRKEASVSSQIFQAHAASERQPTFGRNLSLVCIPLPSQGTDAPKEYEARFVHWQLPERLGRPVQLDKFNRVKALVCVGALREPMDLSEEVVVISDTGVPMQRARGYRCGERPEMDSNMLRLQSMCNIALQANSDEWNSDSMQARLELDRGSSSSSSESSVCTLCRHRVANIPFGVALDIGRTMFQCPCCALILGNLST